MSKESKSIEKSRFAWIVAKQKIAAEMAVILRENQPLAAELNTALHGSDEKSGLGYKELISWYFFESDRDISEIIFGPFIVAFTKTTLGYPEERKLISEIQEFASTTGGVPEELLIDFKAFVEERIDLFEGGLHYLINDYDLLDSLSPGEFSGRRRENRGRHLQKWIDTHPDKVARLNSERMRAREDQWKWSPAMRVLLQRYFDAGYSYKQAARALRKNHGIHTTAGSMLQMTNHYSDLNYRKPTLDRQARDDFDARVARVDARKGRSGTYIHFILLGYKRSTIKDALRRLVQKEKE